MLHIVSVHHGSSLLTKTAVNSFKGMERVKWFSRETTTKVQCCLTYQWDYSQSKEVTPVYVFIYRSYNLHSTITIVSISVQDDDDFSVIMSA